MSQFQLFDTVELKEAIALSGDFSNASMPREVAPIGTIGAIVEIFKDGEAYLVEWFGDWVTDEELGEFRETIGVETAYPHQLRLVRSSGAVIAAKTEVMNILDELPSDLVAEVKDFAEFLAQKQARRQA